MKIILLCLVYCLSVISISARHSDESTALPDTPLLLTPIDRAIDINPNDNFIEWKPTHNARTYRLHLSLKQDFSDTLLYEGNLGTTYYYLSTLSNTTTYFWRVRGENLEGVGEWSNARQFQTDIPPGQAIVIKIAGADSLIGYVALNSGTTWTGFYFNSKIKSLDSNNTVVFTEEDFPALFAGDFTVRRIDFLGLDSKVLMGHMYYDYTFTAYYPSPKRVDILVQFHKKSVIPAERYPGWSYYLKSELPLTALIPPQGLLKSINHAKTPLMLVHGWGGWQWLSTPDKLSNRHDTWQYLYPFDSPMDTTAAFLGRALDIVSAYYPGAPIGVVAHSTGGLVARTLIQSKNYHDNISKLLMLGTPNHGSYLDYKVAFTDEFYRVGNEFLQRFDANSPLMKEITPASPFLFALNATAPKQLFTNSANSLTYLTVAGTNPMALAVTHSENPSQEDGAVAIQSANLFEWNIPLATVPLAHAPNSSTDVTKNLLQNSSDLIDAFFNSNYSPEFPPFNFEIAVEGLWLRHDYVVKPDSRYSQNKKIVELRIPDFTDPRFDIITNSTSNILTFARPYSAQSDAQLYLQRLGTTNNYFGINSQGNGGIGMPFSTGKWTPRFADWIWITNGGRPIPRIIPIEADTTFSLKFLSTTMQEVSPLSPILKSWLLGSDHRQDVQLLRPSNDTIYFTVDDYMDTMLIVQFAPNDSIPSQLAPGTVAATQRFKLIAPNGVSVDTNGYTKTLYPPYDTGGYKNYVSDNVSYYTMARPVPGRWKIVTSATNSTFVQSYLSAVSLKIAIADSLFAPKDTVHFTVVLPNFFYTNPQVTTLVFAPTDIQGSNVALTQVSGKPLEYNGWFVAQTNGIYRVSANLTCDFPAGPIERNTSRSVEVTDALPDAPFLVYPVDHDSSVALNLALRWQHDLRARSYRVQFSKTRNFSQIIHDSLGVVPVEFIIKKLDVNTNYYWRVRAKNARGQSEWSVVNRFKTTAYPYLTPLLTAPIKGSSTIQSVSAMTWILPVSAEKSRIQIAKDTTFNPPLALDTIITSSALAFNMQSNTKYFWRVKSMGSDGESPWSEYRNFKRLLPSPTPVLPLNNSTNLPLNITLKWYSPEISLRFVVQISSKADFSELVFNQTTLGDTIIYANVPSNYTLFHWRVKWILADGTESNWSEVWRFTTMVARPRLDSPGDQVTGVNLNPTLTWNSVTGGMSYHLQVYTDPSLTSKYFEDSLLIVIAKSLKNLPPLTNFYWRVRARTVSGGSEWSDVWKFRTGEPITGVDERESSKCSVNIYPNPAGQKAYLTISGDKAYEYSLKITDLLGAEVYHGVGAKMNGTEEMIELEMPETQGIYFCSIYIGGQTFTHIILRK
ncbi:MAG: T9SS type A sorting domain-containing protein [Ignavibacteria bacterium]|nr:T9SS type A sorting domain-containing protein [Ignavibacteria bacterium]